MCGISGYLGRGNKQLLQDMNAAMVHRGPDGQGLWEDPGSRVGFAHRRLSIVDLSDAGKQPMHSEDGRVTLCYNGELYNHLECRAELQKAGYRFRSNSDTEVVLNLYHHYGLDFLQRLNGIFAMAIWDASEQALYLIRDNMGVKPLYYRQHQDGLYFASEIRALLKTQNTRPTICVSALETFLDFLYVPGELTLFDGIKKLEAGNYAKIHNNNLTIKRWFYPQHALDHKRTESEWVEECQIEFDAAIKRQMVADVTVGAFLSGGIDSSAIVTAACRHTDPANLQCFTISYPEADIAKEGNSSDLPYARRVAKQIGVQLHETEVNPKDLDSLPEIVAAVEEPDADMTSIVTHMISRSAKQAGATVLLSGTGGDEVFYGYRTHLAYRHFGKIPAPLHHTASRLLLTGWKLALPFLGAASPIMRRADRYARAIPLRGVDRHLAISNSSGNLGVSPLLTPAVRETLPRANHLRRTLNRYEQALSPNTQEATIHTWLLQQTFLADHNFLYADKCGMANSIEIRVPFMDRKLMDLTTSIPVNMQMANGVTKNLLRKMMAEELHGEILNRPKVGFNPPIRTWIADNRSELGNELLSESILKKRGFFDSAAVRSLQQATQRRETDGAQLLFAIQYLELWCQEFVDG